MVTVWVVCAGSITGGTPVVYSSKSGNGRCQGCRFRMMSAVCWLVSGSTWLGGRVEPYPEGPVKSATSCLGRRSSWRRRLTGQWLLGTKPLFPTQVPGCTTCEPLNVVVSSCVIQLGVSGNAAAGEVGAAHDGGARIGLQAGGWKFWLTSFYPICAAFHWASGNQPRQGLDAGEAGEKAAWLNAALTA